MVLSCKPKEAVMAKKSAGKVKAKEIRHARIELSPEDYAMVETVARSNGLGVAAYIRMSVLQRARRDIADTEKGGDS
jgi:hypothetical protein